MTHTALKEWLAENAPVPMTKTDADTLLKTLFSKIAEEVVEGNDVKMLGLGTAKRVKRKSRSGRNPQTNEEIHIPERYSLKINVDKSLKDLLKNKLV